MTFFDEVEKHFDVTCLYSAFGISKDANDKEIKKAYHRLSLKYHPDRASSDNKKDSTIKFQLLSKIHSILSNTEQRAVYDETGELLDKSDVCVQDKNWESYWRILFPKVTTGDLITFEKEYRNSNEERDDIKKYYVEFEGDIVKIIEHVMCATYEDEDRFMSMIKKCIEDGELQKFDKFEKENDSSRRKRKQKAVREAKEAAQHAKDIGLPTDKDLELKSLILKRKSDRESEMNEFCNKLEAKYCQPKSKTPGKRSTAVTKSKSTKRKRK